MLESDPIGKNGQRRHGHRGCGLLHTLISSLSVHLPKINSAPHRSICVSWSQCMEQTRLRNEISPFDSVI